MLSKNRKNYSRTSPKTNQRACLCADGNTYSKKCCEGKMINQGIGSLVGGTISAQYLAQENESLILQEDNSNIIT